MKLKLFMWLCATLFIVNSAYCQKSNAAEMKYGYLDKEALLSQMPEMKVINDSLLKLHDFYQTQLMLMEQERANKLQNLLNNQTILTENMRYLKEKEIKEIIQNMQLLEQIASQDIWEISKQLLTPIEKRIDEAVISVAKEYGFTYIAKVRWDDVIPAIKDYLKPFRSIHYTPTPNINTNSERMFITPMGEDVMPLVKEKLQIY